MYIDKTIIIQYRYIIHNWGNKNQKLKNKVIPIMNNIISNKKKCIKKR